MVRIELHTDGNGIDIYYPDEWKDYVAEDFDEKFVITGNRDFAKYENAEWWNEAKTVLGDLDNYEPIPGSVFRYYEKEELTHEQRKAILKVYEECRYSDDTETIVAVANIMYPEKRFEIATIRGYMQSEWAEVVYDAEYKDCLRTLEDWYFGQVTDIHWEDEEHDDFCWCPITNSELWEMQRSDYFKGMLLDYLGEPLNTECEIFEVDGYIQMPKWKQIG